MIPKIKICGIQKEFEISYVNSLKPDYIGLVFAKSKRQVCPEEAANLTKKLDKRIKRVGVFVDSHPDQVKRIADLAGLDIIQLHGQENPEAFQQLGLEIWKSYPIQKSSDFQQMSKDQVDGYLLDSFVAGQRGGSGKSFDWGLIPENLKEKFLILAGGLNQQNLKQAIQTVSPQVLDVSSGVETEGYKDFEKMKNFIEGVRNYHARK